MRYIKKFNEMADSDLAADIAVDLLPKLEKEKRKGKKITPDYFEEFMKSHGGDLSLSDKVLSSLVEMGFDFDINTIFLFIYIDLFKIYWIFKF